MGEPWLDSLSEDWNSQTSSPPAIASTGSTPAKLSQRQFHPSQASFENDHGPPRSFRPNPGVDQRRVLLERCDNDVNISSHSSYLTCGIRSDRDLHKSDASTLSSAGSVLRRTSLAPRKSRSSSPPKTKTHTTTPEWRRLLKHNSGGIMVPNDLFSPINLEGIFRHPGQGENERTVVDVDNPVALLISGFDGVHANLPLDLGGCREFCLTLEDENASVESSISEIANEVNIGNNDETINQIQPLSNASLCIPAELIALGQHHSTLPSVSYDTPSKRYMEVVSRADNIPVRTLNGDDRPAIWKRESICQRPCSVQKRQSSSAVEGFSPVFISKHNTAAGGIDYSALDLSNPHVVEQLKDLQLSGTTGSGITAAGIFADVKETSEANCDVESASIHAREMFGSLNSSSIVPSDSVSQIYAGLDLQASGRDGPEPLERDTPSNLTSNKLCQSLDDRSPSTSPLKLFANHETFTNDKLLGRLTQLDKVDPEVDCDHTDVPNAHFARTMTEHQHLPLELPVEDQKSVLSVETTLHCYRSSGVTEKLEHYDFTRKNRAYLQDQSDVGIDADNVEGTGVDHAGSPSALDTGPSKRSARSPFEQPIPKRQRTVREIDVARAAEHLSNHIEEPPHRVSLTGETDVFTTRKQEDEPRKMDDHLHSPSLAPTHITPDKSCFNSCSQSRNLVVLETDRLSSVRAHIVDAPITCAPEDAFKIRALASEVATIEIRGVRDAYGNARKHSVSTQDYVNEAMKIMDFIRSKRIAQGSGDNVETFNTSESSHDFTDNKVTLPETMITPLSRDEWNKDWRSVRDEEMDLRVISHLKKYQETGDDSFRVSSALQLHDTHDIANDGLAESDETECQPTNIRITDSKYLEHECRSTSYHIKTNSSNASTDSSGRTLQTQSSQRTRPMPVIAPGKVSHLISSIESAAGMRFDREKQTSIGTEDDPLENIPNLSIDDVDELDDIPDKSGHTHGITMLDPSDYRDELLQSANQSTSWRINESDSSMLPQKMIPISVGEESASTEDLRTAPDVQPAQPSAVFSEKQERTMEVHYGRKSTQATEPCILTTPRLDISVDSQTNYAVEDSEILREETLYSGEYDHEDSTQHQALEEQKKKVIGRRPVFSSPPVSREYPSATWHEDTEYTANSQHDEDHPYEITVIRNEEASGKDCKVGSFGSRIAQSRTNRKRHRYASPNRTFSISRIDEHHEVSLVGTGPDGRSMSLAFSISTPLPTHRDASMSRIPCNGMKLNANLQSLSPLSDFTIHQDDAHHLITRHLLQGHRATGKDRSVKSAAVMNQLVTTLTDVEPDEPYWDALRTLNLNSKQLAHLHALGDFCPSLEELDVSSNQLTNLNGVPQFVRHLNVQDNVLSSLTNWEHLMNLQHLDLSDNEVDNLDGLGNLLHLRDLRVDNNNLSSVDGIFDLDSLLSLSARGNRLSLLDFQSADLRRLTKLDIAKNELVTVHGLGFLPRLTTLILDHNRLTEFPTSNSPLRSLHTLRSLSAKHNQFRTVDALQLPSLQYLDVDNNRISHINNLAQLRSLQTVKLRHQSVGDKTFDDPIVFEQFCELRNLYLSGNTIKSFPVTFQLLNLHTLELAFTGLEQMPLNFGRLVPNLRVLNLNSNALRDLRPLRGINKLRRLMVAGNRLSRLRRTLRIIRRFVALEELDLRNNHFSVGFYPSPLPIPKGTKSQAVDACSDEEFDVDGNSLELQHVLPPADLEQDRVYMSRLDEDTRLRRKVYELLLAVECKMLRKVDGLQWNASEKLVKDAAWDTLLELGVVVRIGEPLKDGRRITSLGSKVVGNWPVASGV